MEEGSVLFGKRLYELRTERELTQDALSQSTGIGRVSIAQYEKGYRKEPSYEVLSKLADYFGVTLDYLLGKSPFKTRIEAEHSIRVAAIKKALTDPENKKFIWQRALESTEAGYGFTKQTMQYIKYLHTKKTLTDIEYYDLSIFVAWEIEWPDDLNGPVALVIWETKIFCELNYWSIPRIVIEEWQSKIIYKNPDYDGPPINVTPEEAFGSPLPSNAIPFDPNSIIMLPVYGRIAAGKPITANQEYGEYYPLDTRFVSISGYSHEDFFWLRIKGDSMEPGILNGDLVLVRHQSTVDPNEVGVVVYDGLDATVKRVNISGDKMVLSSDNKLYPPQIYNAVDCQIIGKVLQRSGRVE